MVSESQHHEAIHQIEHALVAMRAGRGGPRRHGMHGRDGHRPPWGDGPPPWGDGQPPWGDGPPPWARGGRGGEDGGARPGRGGRGGPHDRSLAGAARFRLLEALLAAESSGTRMGVSEVAEAIGVDQPRASRLVNDAAERGLVTRRVDERDARRSVVALTDAGREHLQSAHDTRRSAVTEAVAAFTPEETVQFAELLTRFVAAWPR